MSGKEITLKVSASKDTIKKLETEMSNGNIDYHGSLSRTTFTSTSHKDTLETWIDSYGGDARTKRHLTSLKNATNDGGTGNYSFGVLDEGSYVTAFFVHFGDKNSKGERTYNELSISMKFSSNSSEETKKLVRNNPIELAVLVLSGQVSDFKITW